MEPLLTTSTALALCAAPALAASDMAASDHSVGGICYQGHAEIDGNADGKLTRDEVARSTKAAFPKLDADGDGVVTQAEYTDCLNSTAGMMSRESDRSAENMAEYDTDGDGTLTRSEFTAAGQEQMEQAQAGSPDEPGIVRLMFVPTDPQATPDYTTWSPDDFAVGSAMMFAALDTGASGDLTAEEWARTQAKRTDRSEGLREEFDAADADGSGDLTETEYLGMRQGKAELATQRAAASKDEHRAPPVVYYRYDSTM